MLKRKRYSGYYSNLAPKGYESYIIDDIPERLNNEPQYTFKQSFLIAKNNLLSIFNNTGGFVLTQFPAVISPWSFKKPEAICRKVDYPFLYQYYEDGILEEFNFEKKSWALFRDPFFSAQAKPQIVLANEKYIYAITPLYPDIKVICWDKNQPDEFNGQKSGTSSPKCTTLPGTITSTLFGLVQKYCFLHYPNALLASQNLLQIWDLQENQMIYEFKITVETETFMHVKWSGQYILTITRENSLVHDIGLKSITQVKIPKTTTVTSVYIDQVYIITGSSSGEIDIYHTKTGYMLRTLNETKSFEDFSKRINQIEFFQIEGKSLVYVSHENNKFTIWNMFGKEKGKALLVFQTSGPVKEFIICDDGSVQLKINSTSKYPNIIWWNPSLDLWKIDTSNEISAYNVLLQCLQTVVDSEEKPSLVPEVIEESESDEEITIVPAVVEPQDDGKKFFGVSLDIIMKRPNEIGIPSVLKRLIQIITTNGLSTKEIFEFCGISNQEIKNLQATIDSGIIPEISPAVSAELIKKFLLSLPEPLLTFNFYDELLNLAKTATRDPIKITYILQQLPKVNFLILKILVALMKKIEQYKQFTMMTVSRLGKILGEVIIFPRKVTKVTDTQVPLRYTIGKWIIETLSEPEIKEIKENPEDQSGAFYKNLLNPEFRSQFRKFLQSTYSQENLDFWYEAENFKNIDPTMKGVINQTAHYIMNKYVTEASAYELNLNGEMKKELQASITNPDTLMFKKTQSEIFQLMLTHSYPKFKQYQKNKLEEAQRQEEARVVEQLNKNSNQESNSLSDYSTSTNLLNSSGSSNLSSSNSSTALLTSSNDKNVNLRSSKDEELKPVLKISSDELNYGRNANDDIGVSGFVRRIKSDNTVSKNRTFSQSKKAPNFEFPLSWIVFVIKHGVQKDIQLEFQHVEEFSLANLREKIGASIEEKIIVTTQTKKFKLTKHREMNLLQDNCIFNIESKRTLRLTGRKSTNPPSLVSQLTEEQQLNFKQEQIRKYQAQQEQNKQKLQIKTQSN